MKTTFQFALVAALLGMLPAASMADTDCLKLALSVKHSVAAQPAKVLEIVEKEVTANPGCACEVVKAAIQGAEADAGVVAKIVEAAATAAPEKMRLISQCAVAVSPESLAGVQAVMNRLDPNRGESTGNSDAKSSKDVAVKPAWNPLDFPGQGIGPTPGGAPIVVPGLPPAVPPIITPQVIIPPTGTLIDPPIKLPLPTKND